MSRAPLKLLRSGMARVLRSQEMTKELNELKEKTLERKRKAFSKDRSI